MFEKEHRLKRVVDALIDSDSTTEALQKIAEPFLDKRPSGELVLESYEKDIFNEVRLYKALGKEDARSVLAVWRRFRDICELLSRIKTTKK